MARKINIPLCAALIGVIAVTSLSQASEPPVRAELVDAKLVWSVSPHNAFTDLVRWREKWYCGFREGQGHAGDRGKLRIISSMDGNRWESVAALEMTDYDLRDAALSITPDDRLMVLGGAQESEDGKLVTGTFVSFSADGKEFSPPEYVPPRGRWLWRMTWHGDTAYGVSYASPHLDDNASSLLATKDGRSYQTIVPAMFAEGWPTEARLRFAKDGTAYCLQRRDGQPPANSAFLGVAQPPYESWEWHDLKQFFGGPNFIETPQGEWIAAGRIIRDRPTTDLAYLDVRAKQLTPILTLPSGGDTSYPGLVWHDDLLWISYYSSHEGKTGIYLAKARITPNNQQP